MKVLRDMTFPLQDPKLPRRKLLEKNEKSHWILSSVATSQAQHAHLPAHFHSQTGLVFPESAFLLMPPELLPVTESLDIPILLLPGIQLVTKSESRWLYLWNLYCHSWFRLSWSHKQTRSKSFLIGFPYYPIHLTRFPWLIFQKHGCKHTFS